MMTSNKMSTIPSATNTDRKFFDSGLFANSQVQAKLNQTTEDFGSSTLMENTKY